MKNDDENNVDEFLVSLRNELKSLKDEMDSLIQRVEQVIRIKPRLLDQNDAAVYLGYSTAYMEKLRTKPGGPPFIKSDSSANAPVRYDIKDLEKWIDMRTRH